MQPFDYYKPKDFDEAFQLLNMPGKVVFPYAGGTDFIPMSRDGAWKCDAVVDIKGLPGLRDLKETPEGLFIGAAVRMNEIAESDLVKTYWDILAQGAASVGSEQVRNRATLGGNMCTASPCADTPPALCVLGAVAIIRNAQGERRVPVTEFFKWVRKTSVQPGDILVGVVIPRPAEGSAGVYVKLSRRKGSDLSLVSVAAFTTPNGKSAKWKLALGAVAPTPLMAPAAQAILDEGTDEEHILRAAQAAADTSKPISDVRASETYRKLMVANMTKRAVRQTLERRGKGG
jgi:CO/xanthine dehydrogenase FAD-binding subunit